MSGSEAAVGATCGAGAWGSEAAAASRGGRNMATMRKSVSAHDYPEHLNPFRDDCDPTPEPRFNTTGRRSRLQFDHVWTPPAPVPATRSANTTPTLRRRRFSLSKTFESSVQFLTRSPSLRRLVGADKRTPPQPPPSSRTSLPPPTTPGKPPPAPALTRRRSNSNPQEPMGNGGLNWSQGNEPSQQTLRRKKRPAPLPPGFVTAQPTVVSQDKNISQDEGVTECDMENSNENSIHNQRTVIEAEVHMSSSDISNLEDTDISQKPLERSNIVKEVEVHNINGLRETENKTERKSLNSENRSESTSYQNLQDDVDDAEELEHINKILSALVQDVEDLNPWPKCKTKNGVNNNIQEKVIQSSAPSSPVPAPRRRQPETKQRTIYS